MPYALVLALCLPYSLPQILRGYGYPAGELCLRGDALRHAAFEPNSSCWFWHKTAPSSSWEPSVTLVTELFGQGLWLNMKSIVLNDFCERLNQIRVSDVPPPQPKSDEILIKVAAAGVNFVDILYAQGKHQNNKKHMKPPFTLGLEFAGVVISAPPTSSFKTGDAVFGDCQGSYSELLVLREATSSIQKIPSSWSFTEAASLGATLPVSYGALILRGGLKAGETVLVHSAAGGLGVMATQIAVAFGCRVLGTAGSTEKCRYAKSFGASMCFDYSRSDWWERVLEATNGQGADVVFDPVGLVDLSLKCIAHRGRLLIVGFAGRNGQMETIAMNKLLLKQVTLIGYRYGESHRRYPGEKGRIWNELWPLLEEGQIRPPISNCYPSLESVPQALEDLSKRKVSGKAIVCVSSDRGGWTKSML